MLSQEDVQLHSQKCTELLLKAGSGPWDGEPHRREWKAHGFDCLMVRTMTMGAWCGYVGVPKGHPWFEKHYDQVDAEAHGGLTYSNKCQHIICHAGNGDEVWWVGFDCAHFNDILPGYLALEKDLQMRMTMGHEGIYRNFAYVVDEVENLAKQAKDAAAVGA